MKKTLMLAFTAILALSCTKQQEGRDGEVTFLVTRSGAEDTRTVINASGCYAVRWNTGDVISIFDGWSNSPFTTYSTGRSVSFRGRSSKDASVWYAVYPYSDFNDFDPSEKVITATIPTRQRACTGGFADSTNVAAGYTSTQSSLVLRNVCGYIKFRLTRSDVTSVTFTSEEGEHVAGKVRISFTQSGIPVAAAFEGTDTVVLDSGDGSTPLEAGEYCIALLPGTLCNGFTLTLSGASGAVYTRTGSFTVGRSTIVNIGSIDNNYN